MLVGRRQLRSNNSWMHNLELLVSGPERCTLQVHPDDAERLGLADGGAARVENRAGALEATVEVTDAVMPGVVSLPHGWGHDAPGARLGVASAHAGVNANVLADEGLVDAISGNAVLNGIPVAVAPVAARRPRVTEPDFAALGLLDGLDEDARASRLALLQALHEDGVGLEELRTAVAEGRLALLPAERALGADGDITPRALAEEAGLDLAMLEAVRRASGPARCRRPTSPALGPLDVAGARIIARFLDAGLPVAGLIEAARVFGEATAHAAAAAGTIANASIPQEGDTELGYALRLAAATRELTPPAAELLGVLYRLHTRENLRQQIIDAEELAAGRRSDVIEISVGFCDLVGFTRLGEGVPAADLGAIATRLAALAADVARAAGPARQDARRRGDVRRARAAAAARRRARVDGGGRGRGGGELPRRLHAGAAHGTALRRWGDYYGGPVNLAARLAERARPGSLLTDAAVHDAPRTTIGFAWSSGRREAAEGHVARATQVWRCRRAPVTLTHRRRAGSAR